SQVHCVLLGATPRGPVILTQHRHPESLRLRVKLLPIGAATVQRHRRARVVTQLNRRAHRVTTQTSVQISAASAMITNSSISANHRASSTSVQNRRIMHAPTEEARTASPPDPHHRGSATPHVQPPPPPCPWQVSASTGPPTTDPSASMGASGTARTATHSRRHPLTHRRYRLLREERRIEQVTVRLYVLEHRDHPTVG